MTWERYVKQDAADIAIPKHGDLASGQLPRLAPATDAYQQGGRFGRSLVDCRGPSCGRPGR